MSIILSAGPFMICLDDKGKSVLMEKRGKSEKDIKVDFFAHNRTKF